MRSLVNVIQYRVLRSDAGLPTNPNVSRVQLDLHHVSCAHPAALRHAVNQSLVQVKDQGLLGCLRVGFHIDVRWLASWDERSRGRRGFGVFRQGTNGRRGRFEVRRYILLLLIACCTAARAGRLPFLMFTLPEGFLVVKLDPYGPP